MVADNGCTLVVNVVQARLEELQLQGEARVDVIVSEWMGYGLYFENMLSSVLVARDRFLAPDGILIPSHCRLFIQAVSFSSEDDRINFWDDVFGIRMSRVGELFVEEAQVQLCAAGDARSQRATLHELDLKHIDDDDLDFSNGFLLVCGLIHYDAYITRC
jgi:hypothetical protein